MIYSTLKWGFFNSIQFTFLMAGLPSSFSRASSCFRARNGADVDPDFMVTLLVSEEHSLSNSSSEDLLNIVERDQYEQT